MNEFYNFINLIKYFLGFKKDRKENLPRLRAECLGYEDKTKGYLVKLQIKPGGQHYKLREIVIEQCQLLQVEETITHSLDPITRRICEGLLKDRIDDKTKIFIPKNSQEKLTSLVFDPYHSIDEKSFSKKEEEFLLLVYPKKPLKEIVIKLYSVGFCFRIRYDLILSNRKKIPFRSTQKSSP